MTEILLPIGQFGGADELKYPVRAGNQVYTLPADQFATWVYAHGVPGHNEPWTEAALTPVLVQGGVSDPIEALEALRETGLIIAVDPADARDFASGHTLSPLLMGLGEVGEPVEGYSLGLLDNPITTVAGPLFAFWAWCAVEPDIWSACVRLAQDAVEAGGDDLALTDPGLVLQGLLSSMHGLLSASAAYLDRVPS